MDIQALGSLNTHISNFRPLPLPPITRDGVGSYIVTIEQVFNNGQLVRYGYSTSVKFAVRL